MRGAWAPPGKARVSSYPPYSVAEFAWALALAANRRTVRVTHRTRESDFRPGGLMGRDPRGPTAGVVGTGKIGTAFTRIAQGFGMRQLGWDIAENPDCLALGMEYVPRERLFAEADLVSLHVPLLTATHHLTSPEAMTDERLARLMTFSNVLVV